MRYPLDKYTITQRFGDNPQIYGIGGHTGIDLASPEGTPILSPVTGTVISVGTNPKYEGGLYSIIREDSTKYEYYMGHQSLIEVKVGQRVTEGQEIGKVGHTGNATGSHVHFQIRRFGAGSLIDPETLIQGEDMGRIQELETENAKLKQLAYLDWVDIPVYFKNYIGTQATQADSIYWRGKPRTELQDNLASNLIRQNNELKAQLGQSDEANLLGRALIKLIASFGYKKG